MGLKAIKEKLAAAKFNAKVGLGTTVASYAMTAMFAVAPVALGVLDHAYNLMDSNAMVYTSAMFFTMVFPLAFTSYITTDLYKASRKEVSELEKELSAYKNHLE